MLKYDIVLVTNIPSFYKVRLWNEIAKSRRVLVILVLAEEIIRNSDFVSVQQEYEYRVVKNSIKGIFSTLKVLCSVKYDKLIIGGWNNIVYLISPFFSKKAKNSLICESGIYEYKSDIFKDFIKRMYLTRFFRIYVPGVSQYQLLREHFSFSGEITISGGCGLLRYVKQPEYECRKKVNNFLYIGRLSPEKNLSLLIDVFNTLPEFHLNIIGFGPLETTLKEKAESNISFLGAINNSLLPEWYQKSDVFILPSKCEPWGLVVEEALNNGIPVIVSNKVGCHKDLVKETYGIVFDYQSFNSLREAIISMTDLVFYNSLRHSISYLDFDSRAQYQIETYLR